MFALSFPMPFPQIVSSGSGGKRTKYIIQFGAVRSSTQARDNIATMETSYFAGTILRAQYDDPALGRANLDQQVSRDYAIPYSLLEPDLAVAQSINFQSWTQNFLRLDIARPGLTNMLDTASRDAFINNIRVGARFAFQAGYVGLLLDMEAYDSAILWSWPDQPVGPTFADYQAAYLDAGIRAMSVIEQEFIYRPAQVIIAVSYEQLKNIVTQGQLEAYRYGLLPKFLDGLHDNATTTRLTCMCEEAYVNKTAADMDDDIRLQTPPDVPWLGSSNYSKVHLNGLSTWLDANGPPTFSYTNPENNYFTPAGFQNALDLMIPRVDLYLVVYTDSATRWPGYANTPANTTPNAYIQVLNNMIYSSPFGYQLL